MAPDCACLGAPRARFEELLAFAPDAIVGVGADGRIVAANAQTEAMFGHTREELLEMKVEQLVPERFHALQPGGRTRPAGAELELFGVRKDGTEFPAEISLSNLDVDGRPLGIAAIRDISERVEAQRVKEQLEAQIGEAGRLESDRDRGVLEAELNQLRRLESVGQLAGGIAHDFNNILGVIINYAQFVEDELAPGSHAIEDVQEIRRAAERAAALTRQLLIFSRREVVRPQILDLNLVVSELDKLLRRALGEHIELETRFAADLLPIEADPGQLEQVLVNLAVNARDAMPSGGRLIVETATVELDAESLEADVAPGTYVRLSVSDTGSGMTSDVAAHAFDPFFTTKPAGAGTGLGLPTVYGIVTDAGGDIRLYSEPGMGTTVNVHFPVAPVPGRADPPPAAGATGRGETVLVVEDEDGVRRLIERILGRSGYQVLLADRGKAALAMLDREAQVVDLLLSDVVMPEMLGTELVAEATRRRPHLKVLYMSGYIHQVIAGLDPERADDIAFVEKPFTAATLLHAVRAALDASVAP